jgi:hypothetical protein
MGNSGDHCSQGPGIPVELRLGILEACNLSDEIPSPAASLGSGRLERPPPQTDLVAKRKNQKSRTGN